MFLIRGFKSAIATPMGKKYISTVEPGYSNVYIIEIVDLNIEKNLDIVEFLYFMSAVTTIKAQN